MKRSPTRLTVEDLRVVAAWVEQNSAQLPEPVRAFWALHRAYLTTEGAARKPFDSAWRELRRALGITPSSEKRPSGALLAAVPPGPSSKGKSAGEKLEERLERSERLGDWHDGLGQRHHAHAKHLRERLAKMPAQQDPHVERVEDIELTPDQKAEAAAAGRRFVEHLIEGNGVDPAFTSVNETLMPGGAVLATEERVALAVETPEDLADANVVKTMVEERERYDFAVTVRRITLEVDKKIVVDAEGQRHVLTASTTAYGPPRYSVTWSALATLAIMVGQFAVPLNRLGTMLSTAGKRFTASMLSRMLHYVAVRLVPIYLELAAQLADSEVLAGDDTSSRVVEVSRYFAQNERDDGKSESPPWAAYRTTAAAQESLRRCEQLRCARLRCRADGDRDAKRTAAESPTLGMLIGRQFTFESPRRNGDGPKRSLNTTVVSGRSAAADPRSLIVWYRSHLGGCGNLFEALLARRNPRARRVVLQGDLSATNLVTAPELHKRFDIRSIGCTSHARRPFANYEHEDPDNCAFMLHLFLGLAIHEQRLDVHGRNRENILAVRGHESRKTWRQILELAKDMTKTWSPATKLGAGAAYIIKHFDKLTAYLDDPRLEYTNNMRERMLRTEKLIEGSSMFRRSLEGRFALDVIRTVLQTAVAGGVPVHQSVVAVLRADQDEIINYPSRFTPRAWAAARTSAEDTATLAP